MDLVFLSGFDRTVEDYDGWLKSLTPRKDKVAFQRFRPYDDSSAAFGASFERWELTLVSYTGRTLFAPGMDQPIRPDGVACWHNSESEWGDVFPARIVPYVHWKGLKAVGDRVLSLNPIYEPFYVGKTRSLYLVPFGKTEQGLFEFKRQGLRHYYREVAEGRLVTVFSDEPPTMNDGAVPLYAEYIRD